MGPVVWEQVFVLGVGLSLVNFFFQTVQCHRHGGVYSSVLDTNPRGVGGGGGGLGGGGGSRKFFPVLGAFLNSPFHSEHLEYSVGGGGGAVEKFSPFWGHF